MPNDSTTSIPLTDPVLIEPTTLTIAGNEYTLRRLGLRDVFKVSRILGRGIAALAENGITNPGQVLQVLVASMNQNEDEFLKLIADLLNVKRTDLDDPDLFPMESFIDIVAAIAASQDLRGFFSKVQALTGSLPAQSKTQTR